MSDRITESNNQGQKDASEGKLPNTPWCGPFESFDHYDKRVDAYNAGYDNTDSQKYDDSSGCFLTTACVQFAGLADNCHELTVLRQFRDSYVRGLPHGQLLIDEYYATAPQIVDWISHSHQRVEILQSTFATIRKAVINIQAGQVSEAFELYSLLFRKLKTRYLSAQ